MQIMYHYGRLQRFHLVESDPTLCGIIAASNALCPQVSKGEKKISHCTERPVQTNSLPHGKEAILKSLTLNPLTG